jgi:hypothetical protein
MEVRFHPGFDAQRSAYSFRFTCEDCAHFDERDGTCLHGFPNRLHRLARYEGSPRPDVIVFCKDFDLV